MKKIINQNISELFEKIISNDTLKNYFFKVFETEIKEINDSKKTIYVNVEFDKVKNLPNEIINYSNIKSIKMKVNQLIKKEDNGDICKITYKSKIIEPDNIKNILSDFSYNIYITFKKKEENKTKLIFKTSQANIVNEKTNIITKPFYNMFLNYINNIFSTYIVEKIINKIDSLKDDLI